MPSTRVRNEYPWTQAAEVPSRPAAWPFRPARHSSVQRAVANPASLADDQRVTAEERFRSLVEAFAGEPGVTLPGQSPARGFGSDALKVHGAIFAMLVYGQLVVKLPAARVQALVDDGTGQPFTAGKNRPMREWVVVPVERHEVWEGLAREALSFVGTSRDNAR